MSEVATKLVTHEGAPIRRFNMADLQKHGLWIIKRLQKVRPSMSDPQIMTWLKSLIYSNEYWFQYQEHAVALAQVFRDEMLDTRPIVRERFVFAEVGHEKEAAEFYPLMARWAEALQSQVLIVEEMTDVPHDLIKEKVGRIFERKVLWVKV